VSKTLFDPDWGNPSLRTLTELEAPEPVSMFPSSPGWWILWALLLGLLARSLWRQRQRYLREQYRRDALAQLNSIQQRVDSGATEALRELAPLLRATAIAAAGRHRMVSLQGEAYLQALSELAPQNDPLPLAQLQELAYAPLGHQKPSELEPLIRSLEEWIRQHRCVHA